MSTTLTNMKINHFATVTSHPIIDTFFTRTFDGAVMELNVHQNPTTQEKFFVIRGGLQVYGWTTDATTAFNNFHNLSVYTTNEIYKAFRK